MKPVVECLDSRLLTTMIFDLDTGLTAPVPLVTTMGTAYGGHGDFIAQLFSRLDSRGYPLTLIGVGNGPDSIDPNLVRQSISIIARYGRRHPREPIVVVTPFTYDFSLGQYFDRLSRQGILISAAAGNESSPVSNLPTSRLVVSALSGSGMLWPYSNYGSTVGTIVDYNEGTSGAALRGGLAYAIVSDSTARHPNLNYVRRMTRRIESPPLPNLRFGQFSLADL